MSFNGSYETKLLRLLIGFFHVSLLTQLAAQRHGKPLENLTKEERETLEKDMLENVFAVAGQVSEEAISGSLQKIPIVH